MQAQQQSGSVCRTIPIVWVHHAWQADVGAGPASGRKDAAVVIVVGPGSALRRHRILPHCGSWNGRTRGGSRSQRGADRSPYEGWSRTTRVGVYQALRDGTNRSAHSILDVRQHLNLQGRPNNRETS